jgi:hypothetical protein
MLYYRVSPPIKHIHTLNVINSHINRDRIVIFAHLKSHCSKCPPPAQCIVDNDVQQTGRRSVLLLKEHRHMQFQCHATGLAVYVVLRCKQHSLEHPTGKSLWC